MAAENFFTWGENGSKLTPEQIAIAKQLLARKKAQGADTSPVQHWTQGAARVADALSDVIQSKRLDAAEKDNTSYNSDILSGLLTGGGASASIPAPAAAGEMAATAPKYDAAPVTAKGEVADYIRQSAAARGIDPDIALRVALSEGGVNDPVRQSLVVKNGVREASYGPFQLYMGGGLGNKALAAGIDPRDPNQWKQGVDFALDQAKSGGWSPWYGAKKIGVTGMMGIGNSPIQPTAATPAQVAPNQVASLDPSAGMPMPGATGQMRASDPAQVMPPQGVVAAPPLPPATTVAAPPPVASVPSVAPAPVQGVQVAQDTGPSLAAAIKVMSDPRANANTRAIAQIIVQQQQARQQAILENQLKQADPKYRQDLEKGNIELQNLRAPKMSPAEQAMDAREREKMAFEHEKFNAEVQKGQWQKLTDGRLYNQTTGDFRDAPPPAPGTVTPKFDDISSMRKEIQQLPAYKNLAAAAPIYKAMAETAGRNSKASDLNLVYGLGKIMDPTSVVREGEMIMVKNTASLPDWLQGAIASLNGGAALTPETRKAIMTEAYGRVKGYNDEFQQNMGQYQGIVQRNGINPADVIPEVDKFDPWTPPEATGPVQIKNVDDYNALPKGTPYLDPNGKLRTKQ